MTMRVYLSGEIHTDWRDQIIAGAAGLDVVFSSPVTDHAASDDCGVAIMGEEDDKFWHDNKGARLNAIRTRKAIVDADVVVVRFGEKYRQWNAAFDAGYASALGKSLIIMHGADHQHALKEVDAAALAVTQTPEQIVQILRQQQEAINQLTQQLKGKDIEIELLSDQLLQSRKRSIDQDAHKDSIIAEINQEN